MNFNRRSIATICFVPLVTVAVSTVSAQNLDVGLTALSEHAKSSMPEASTPGVHSQTAQVSSTDKDLIPGRFDEQDRVLVHVLLDGQNSIDEVGRQIQSLNGVVLDRNSTYRHGIFAAYVPTDQLENITGVPGVRALVMEHKPIKRAGKFSSQSREVLRHRCTEPAGAQWRWHNHRRAIRQLQYCSIRSATATADHRGNGCQTRLLTRC